MSEYSASCTDAKREKVRKIEWDGWMEKNRMG